MSPLKEEAQLFANLATSLAAKDVPPNGTQTCPRCQGTLHVSADLFQWQAGNPKWCIYMRCEDCGAELFFEGIVPQPSWDIPDES